MILDHVIPVVCAIIENDNGDTLISQRRAGIEYGKKWEFPGGKVEPKDETLQAALVREIKEELGCIIDPYHFYTEREMVTERGNHVDLYYFKCRVVSGVPSPVQVQAVKFVPIVELLDYDLLPMDVEIAAELMELAGEL